MYQHEVEALKKLKLPLRRWGDSYRLKVRGKSGRYTYVSNITKPSVMQQIVKQYPNVFKTKDTKVGAKKLKTAIEAAKPRFKSWENKKKKTYLLERYSQKEVFDKMENLLRSQTKTFKANVSFGYTLVHRETGEEQYWYPSTNTNIFERPIQINSKIEIERKIIDVLRNTDFSTLINFPSSPWMLKEISAFNLVINPFDHRLGDEKIIIPKVISDNRHIINYPSTENKCVLFCLAGFMNPKKDYRRLNTDVKSLFKQYCSFKDIEYSLPFFKSFEGVDLIQFDEIEECFQLNINVFEMDLETQTVSVKRESTKTFKQIMNVLDYKGHAMLIPRIDKLEGKHICDRCDQIFATPQKLADHKRHKCDQKVLESFASKPTVYTPPENKIKRLLRKYGIKGVDHYIDHFIVYDFEAILKPINAGPSDETRYVAEHDSVSVSICDSLTQQVRNFISDDVKDLVKQMFDYIHTVQGQISTYNEAKFKLLIDKVDTVNSDKDKSTLDECMKSVPLLGFNSGRYDINLIKKEMIAILDPKSIRLVIKNPSYMCIATDRLKMLDICNYLPAGTSYDSYLKSYLGGCKCDNKIECVCGLGKGLFPYEYITSFDKLNETELPPKEAFDSKFKNTKISDADYERIKFVWSHYKMKSIKDLLIWYNNLDVEPFIKAVIEQRKFYKRFDLDMLQDGFSLPSLAEKIMYKISHKELEPIKRQYGKSFEFPSSRLNGYRKQDKDAEREFDLSLDHLNDLLSKQKYSCAYCCCALNKDNVSADRINNKEGHIDGIIVISCVACNCARKDMSISGFRYQKKLEYNADRLVYSIDAENKDIYKKMKQNIAGGPSIIFSRYAEVGITKIRPYLFSGEKNLLAKLCQIVIGFDANALYLWALANDMPCGRLTTIEPYDGIIDDIMNDKVFGFLECDIETPEHLKEYFSEMTPIFKNTEIDPCDRDVIGNHMYEHNLELKKMKMDKRAKSKKLIGSYFGKQILVYTPLLEWYLTHGMVITKMYSFIRASRYRPFAKFAEEVSDARRAGDESLKTVARIMHEKLPDSAMQLKSVLEQIIASEELDIEHVNILADAITKEIVPIMSRDELKKFNELVEKLKSLKDSDGSQSMIAEMMKLVGNAAFGRSGMDKSKHKDVKFACDETVDKYTKKIEFYDMDVLENSYEVSLKKRKIKLNNPIHISIAIYQLAKLRMLQFYYDCIDFYFDRSDFQYLEMDTDSGYMTFSDEKPFENLIKPELRDHFEQNKHKWFPREDTKEHAMYDRRTPGLFKEEWRGKGMYAIASKNYICFNPDEGYKVKISSKGVQGSNDKENKRNANVLCPEAFGQIVHGEEVSIRATNKGFRVDRKTQKIITYEQTKRGISYWYDKRKVLSDGISTIPLDI